MQASNRPPDKHASATGTRRRGPSLRRKVVFSLVTTVVVLGVLEASARLLWSGAGHEYQPIILLQPHASATIHGIRYELNELGLRDRHQVEKRPGVQRILLLGDSFVFGDGLAEHDTISAQLEESLRAERPAVEVINTGRNGFGPNDELTQLKEMAPQYDPELVVLFFFTNDVLHVAPDGGQPQSLRFRAKEYLRRNSHFAAFLYFHYKAHISSKIGVPKQLLPSDYFDLDDSKPGWVAFKDAFKQIQSYCHERKIGFLFVTIPSLTSLNENYPYQELRQTTCDFAIQQKVQTIDLFDVFSAYDPVDLWVNEENTHWNGLGTRLAAARLTEPIRQLLEN